MEGPAHIKSQQRPQSRIRANCENSFSACPVYRAGVQAAKGSRMTPDQALKQAVAGRVLARLRVRQMEQVIKWAIELSDKLESRPERLSEAVVLRQALRAGGWIE